MGIDCTLQTDLREDTKHLSRAQMIRIPSSSQNERIGEIALHLEQKESSYCGQKSNSILPIRLDPNSSFCPLRPPGPIVSISALATIFGTFPQIRRTPGIAYIDRSYTIPRALLLGLHSPTLHWSQVAPRALAYRIVDIGSLLCQRVEIRPSRPFSSHFDGGMRVEILSILQHNKVVAEEMKLRT